ncbi:MAG: AAA family ATPase, partial [Chloroflexota bacterium]
MFITRMDLENFGPFSGERLDDFPPGLSVLHGPNEAGKSAIRAFLRMVFFGFLGKGSREYEFYHYPPVMGGNPAGAVEVCATDGRRLRVRRTSGKTLSGVVEVTGDQRGGEDVLRDLLGRMEWELYQNVFSVSLSELQRFDTLNRDEVRDRIYSAGLGLGAVSLPSVMDKLDDERSTPQGLWSPNKGTLRAAINELSQKRRELEEARQALSEYEGLAEQRRTLERQARAQAEETKGLRARRNRTDRLLDLRPHWSRRAELIRRIQALPEPGRFPQDGLARLEKLNEEERSLSQAIDEGDRKAEARQREAGQLQIIEAFQRHEPAIRELRSRAEQYAQAVRDLPEVEAELEETTRRVDAGLASLGARWDREALEQPLDVSSMTDRTNAAGERLGGARQVLRDAEAETARNDDELRRAEAAARASEAQRDGLTDVPGESAEELRGTWDRLERLRQAVSEYGEVKNRKEQTERLLADIRSREQAAAARAREPQIPLRVLSLLSLAAALLLLVGGFATEAELIGIPGAIVSGTIGVILWMSDAR